MKMFKTISIFILLFTGCCVKHLCVAAAESESESPSTLLPVSSITSPATSGYIPDSVSESDTSLTAPVSQASLLVAGLSIAFVLFLICVVIGIWNARKFSKRDSFDIASVPSGEA